ncbi:MAG: alpha-amylase family glycosyl hydrolase [Bacteroidota bacterium]
MKNVGLFFVRLLAMLAFFVSSAAHAEILKNLAYPLYLKGAKTDLYLSDYVADCSLVDSVSFHPSIMKIQSGKPCQLFVVANVAKLPPITEMKIWSKGKYESVPVVSSRKESRQIFFDAGDKTFKSVSIAGDFNNWNPKANMFNQAGKRWIAALSLYPGTYSYQLVVDGKWMLDPTNRDSVSNGNGGFNSVLRIGRPPEILPAIWAVSHNGRKIRIESSNKRLPDSLLVWVDNQKLPAFAKSDSAGFDITIPQQKDGLHWIRVMGYNKLGVSNDLLIPLKDNKIDVQSCLSTERSMVMYFPMVDRFLDGNKANTKKVEDKEIDPKANYMGGDLAGITQKIKDGYFTNLGINAIWLSPIVENPAKGYVEFPEPHRKYSGYHGYWPVSGTKIDSRFGTAEEFKILVNEAHAKGIKILLDFVSNHVHEEHPLYKKHKEWTTPLTLKDGTKNIRLWDEQRLTTWFDTFLPDLDYSKPEVVEAMTDTACWWIKTYDIDGFRHDATTHVPEEFWRALTLKLRKNFPDKKLFQIGETFGSRELIATYVNQGEQDAQFDFNTYFDARSYFVNPEESADRLRRSLQETFAWYGSHHLMGNISGNHDLPRFISYASGAMSFSEDDKKPGWERNIEVKDTLGYYRLLQLQAFNLTIPGIPVIYYGDEIGMPGANDPDNRRMMRFSELNSSESRVLKTTAMLSNMRKNSPALLFGETVMLRATNAQALSYARQYFDEIVLVVFNKKSSFDTIQVSLPEAWAAYKAESLVGGRCAVEGGKLVAGVSAAGFDIIKLKP